VNILTVALLLFGLFISAWPGGGGACVVLPLFGLGLLLGVVWLLVVADALRSARRHRVWIESPRALLTAPAAAGTAVVLFLLAAPQRIGFLTARPAPNALLATAPASPYAGGAAMDRRVGIYRVDAYATDPRGGMYFRTASETDGIGPDTVSYGFVFRPNRTGSPFGTKVLSHGTLVRRLV
jgi:hypothetical protein